MNKYKCAFPGCDHDIETVCSIPGCDHQHDVGRLCDAHAADATFLGMEIARQAAVVSALAVAIPVLDKEAYPIAAIRKKLNRETYRLAAMQSRRIQYLKLAGFDRIDEGTE